MPTHLRFLCQCIGLAGCLACFWARPYDLADLKQAWLAMRDCRQEQEAERRREADLARKREIVERRISAKRQVARQVIGRELTLVQAAAWFRFLSETPEDCREYEPVRPGRSVVGSTGTRASMSGESPIEVALMSTSAPSGTWYMPSQTTNSLGTPVRSWIRS